MTVPYIFANATGTLPLSELDANFANVKAATDTAGIVTANAQPNIRSVGVLTGLSVSGNVVIGLISGNGSGLATLTGSNVTGFVANASFATLATTASVANSVTGANVTGTVANATYATSAGSATTATTAGTANAVAGANVSGTVANATYATSAGLATTANTVTDAAQGNITSVGILTSLSVSGNITAANLGNISSLNLNSNASTVLYGNGTFASLPASSSYGNANVVANLAALGSNPVSTTGNITSGNISTGKITLTNGAVIKDTTGEAIAFGENAGLTSQGIAAIAIGRDAGNNTQGIGAVAVGANAAFTGQGIAAIAIGGGTGEVNQGFQSVAVGNEAGKTNQGANAIAIGKLAGATSQGLYSIAIGHGAGETSQANNSIVINATGATLDNGTANAFKVAPVRNDVANIGQVMFYNTTSKEVTYGNTISTTGNVTGSFFIGNGSALTSLTGGNITGTVANATYALNANVATFAGTVTNATQSNITQVGTLANLSVSGTTTTANLIVLGNIVGNTGNAVMTVNAGNTNAGNISFILGTGNNSAQFSFALGATSYGFQVSSYANIAGNVRAGNILTGGLISATGTVAGDVVTANYTKTTPTTVSALTSAGTVGAGTRAFVTDADSITFGNVAVGGASNSMPVFSNGTNWYIG